MLITLFFEEGMTSIVLPSKVSGQYWIKDFEGKAVVGIEGIEGEWYLKSSKRAEILDNEARGIRNARIREHSVYNLRSTEDGKKMFLYTEPVTDDRKIYRKFAMFNTAVLTIGRDEAADICFRNSMVSSKHCSLSYNGEMWYIKDEGSKNGTFVNGCRVANTLLKPGDVINIMGLRIIIGSCYFAINNPDGEVRIRENNMSEYLGQEIKLPEDDYEISSRDYYYCSPRFKRDISTMKLTVDSPPENQVGTEMPLLLVLGPSVTMGLASLVMAVTTISTALENGNIVSAIPSMAMSFSMMLGTILWPILSKKYDKNRRRKREEKRQEKYTEYLGDIVRRIENERLNQETILHENFVTNSECIRRVRELDRKLWERSIHHNDALQLRLGIGNLPMDIQMLYAQRHFTLDEDNLHEQMLSICEVSKELRNVPVTVSLKDEYILGVIGSETDTKNMVNSLILQLSTLYSAEEIKMIFLYDEKDKEEYEYVKWLPHVWNEEKNYRFIATDDNELKDISTYINKLIENRETINENDMEEELPYYVMFVLSRELGVRSEPLKNICKNKRNLNISLVTCYEMINQLPKECMTVIELASGCGRLYDKDDISGKYQQFVPDVPIKEDIRDIAVALGNIQLDTQNNTYKLPSIVTFLEMYDVGKTEHLNSMTRWMENDPTKTLEAPVGVDSLGGLFKLDLHEKFHGPHGLVAGMTGSGKSEFIMTYILSLAVNYHPDEVAFILIDYKGGGMAKSFESLPHIAGIITNLDGNAIKRSLVSIESELKRRQAIFAETSKRIGISNIDIYKYQKLKREGRVNEPLQHLFIISDEFAELKTQQPEFMAQLISAARIGRSLGVHLILATQKPSGVVDDQIWSNSKFRVCLKVQDRSDSMDMINKPDAAELSVTGRFYLQVGYNELFEMGQSAWAGAKYCPSEKTIKERDNSVSIVSRTGHTLGQIKPKVNNIVETDSKQLDEVVAYLHTLAEEESIRVRQICMPEIPAIIYYEDIVDKYEMTTEKYVLNPFIGLYDALENQEQKVLRLDISGEGNAIIFGSQGCGKTSFINVMIYSLITSHSPSEVNMYLLDFASETLKMFEGAPHVGNVILSYEEEKVRRTFEMLEKQLAYRKKLFADYGGEYGAYIRNSGESIENIIVVINNYVAFAEIYDKYEELVGRLTREGSKYGIYFILAANSTNVIRYRLLQNFKQLIALQLNDASEYNSVVGKTEGLYPSKCKGRGLVKLAGNIYEFQTAEISKEKELYRYVKEYCKKLAETYSGQLVNAVSVAKKMTIEDVAGYIEKGSLNIPIAVKHKEMELIPVMYNFGERYITPVLSNKSRYRELAKYMANTFIKNVGIECVIIDIDNQLGMQTEDTYTGLKACTYAVQKMFDIAVERFKALKEDDNRTFENMACIILSIEKLRNELSSDDRDRLDVMLENGSSKLGIAQLIVDEADNLFGVMCESWYRKQVSAEYGIWVGEGILSQHRLELGNKNNIRNNVSDSEGYIVKDGMGEEVEFIVNRQEDGANE